MNQPVAVGSGPREIFFRLLRGSTASGQSRLQPKSRGSDLPATGDRPARNFGGGQPNRLQTTTEQLARKPAGEWDVGRRPP